MENYEAKYYFVQNLFDSTPYGVGRMDLYTASEDLERFRREGWDVPEGLTPEEYMNEWNRLADEENPEHLYTVEYTDPETGATSPIDIIRATGEYTAENYIDDCNENADQEYCEMLNRGEIKLVEMGCN